MLMAINRSDVVEENQDLSRITLTNLLEFSYLFGSLAEGLVKFDGVLLTLCVCSAEYAEKMLTTAGPGTFCLYVMTPPTAETLTVFGVAFMNTKNKVVHKRLFREPVCKKFFCDPGEPCFEKLDSLVASAVGTPSIFARQTRAKMEDMVRVRKAVQKSKEEYRRELLSKQRKEASQLRESHKRMVSKKTPDMDGEGMAKSAPVFGNDTSKTATPKTPRSPRLLTFSTGAAGHRNPSPRASPQASPRGSPRMSPRGSFRKSRGSMRVKEGAERDNFMLEIELLLEEDTSSSHDTMASVVMARERGDTEDRSASEMNVSEMMLRNQYCVLCGDALEDDFVDCYCENCKRYKNPVWRENELREDQPSEALTPDVRIEFVRKSSVSEKDLELVQSRVSARQERMLGLNVSVDQWQENVKAKQSSGRRNL